MIENINDTELVDIRDVSVDKNLAAHERLIEFVRQIKNPYLFKCGKFTITAHFAADGLSMEECMRIMVTC